MSIIEEVKEEMCDHYCRYPYELIGSELADICEHCPLDKLEVKYDDREGID